MKKVMLLLAGIVGAGAITASGVSLASAATITSKSTTVGSSTIPRTTFHEARQQAEATVLNTTVDKIVAAHKDHSFKQLLTSAGLTHKTFDQKVRAELTTQLQAKGYSQQEITIALQHKHIHRLEHRLHKQHASKS